MEYIRLSNGVELPKLGYGTLHIPALMAETCVSEALQAGYRLIDTAAAYFNETAIGLAIKKTDIPRAEICITTKVWVQDSGYEKTKKAFYTSLEKLGVDYIDVYLIHHPYGDYYGSWKAMEELYEAGKIRAIGVCNFSKERFVDLYMNCDIKPMINQIEFHPFFQQTTSLQLLKEYQCQTQSWGPLNEGQSDIFNQKFLLEIAKKHKKQVAQIILRWHIQLELVAIPKTIHRVRMLENMDIWDFELDTSDMNKISQLTIGHSEIIDHQCYATAKTLNKCKIHE